jgi:hypothetical protein
MTIFTIEKLSSPQRIHFFSAARWRGVDLILARSLSEGLLLKTQQLLSLTDVSSCENSLN